MANFINLTIFSPYKKILDKEILKMNFQDKNGNLTILPRHQDYVSSFETNLLTCVDTNNKKFFIVVNDGVLNKVGRDIQISAYSSFSAQTLEELKEKFTGFNRRQMNIKTEKEKKIDENLKNLEMYFFENGGIVNAKNL